MKIPPPQLRSVLIAVTMVLIIVQIVALSPSSLEETPLPSGIEPKTLMQEALPRLATGIPANKIPDYSVDEFHYVSTQGGRKQWKLVAEKAFLYNRERLVHARTIVAYLYDPNGETTVVTGKEAKYHMDERDLEVFGAVQTRFPDGFQTQSEYLRYRPSLRHVDIPVAYLVEGDGDEKDGQHLAFTSQGLEFAMEKSEIYLPAAVHLTMTKKQKSETQGVPDTTRVESDHCAIDRKKRLARFTMASHRPLNVRFVQITQPTLFVRSRWADLNYGDYSELLQYMVAHEDVLVRELGQEKAEVEEKSLRYATSGRADFDTRRNVITLTEFPQVYQDSDTITGEKILLYRDTDVVEVEHSNAFIDGQQQPQ